MHIWEKTTVICWTCHADTCTFKQKWITAFMPHLFWLFFNVISGLKHYEACVQCWVPTLWICFWEQRASGTFIVLSACAKSVIKTQMSSADISCLNITSCSLLGCCATAFHPRRWENHVCLWYTSCLMPAVRILNFCRAQLHFHMKATAPSMSESSESQFVHHCGVSPWDSKPTSYAGVLRAKTMMRHTVVESSNHFDHLGFFQVHWKCSVHGPLPFLPPPNTWLPHTALSPHPSGQQPSTITAVPPVAQEAHFLSH